MILCSAAHPPSSRRFPSRPAWQRMVFSLVCAAIVTTSSGAAHAWDYRIDKWWSGQNGSWSSANWSTHTRERQMLRFKTCRITNHDYPYTDKVTIHLVEVKKWMPDVVRASWPYRCSNTTQDLVGGMTSSTAFHFDYGSYAGWPRTSGTMSVYHS